MGAIFSPRRPCTHGDPPPLAGRRSVGIILVLSFVAMSGLADVLSTDQQVFEQFEAKRGEDVIDAEYDGAFAPVGRIRRCPVDRRDRRQP